MPSYPHFTNHFVAILSTMQSSTTTFITFIYSVLPSSVKPRISCYIRIYETRENTYIHTDTDQDLHVNFPPISRFAHYSTLCLPSRRVFRKLLVTVDTESLVSSVCLCSGLQCTLCQAVININKSAHCVKQSST